MAGRDDFTEAVKKDLAGGVGFGFSKPDCHAQPSGPSGSRVSGASNVGVAAHIAAAAEGGPRHDPMQPPEERSSRENGLWLCATHGEGIDNEERYTVALLVGWRESAEALARAEQGRPDPDTPDSERRLVPYSICIDSCDEVHRDVQEVLEDVGANRCWGRQYQLRRMVATKLAVNAFEHGGVEQIEIEASDGAVTLRDKGDAFGIEDLKHGGNGGRRALADLETHAKGTFTLRYRRGDDFNEWAPLDEGSGSGGGVSFTMFFQGPPRGTPSKNCPQENQPTGGLG